MCIRYETPSSHHCAEETCFNRISVVVCRPDLGINDLILDRKVAPPGFIHINFYIPVCSGVYNKVAMLGHIFTALCRFLDVKAQAVYEGTDLTLQGQPLCT